MFRCVAIPAEKLEVVEVQRDCRVVDVVGTDVTLVVDDDAGLVYASSEAPFT